MTQSPTPYETLEKAAEHFKVSVSTFRSWVRSGVVPDHTYIRQGSVYRFNLPAVEEALLTKPEETGETR